MKHAGKCLLSTRITAEKKQHMIDGLNTVSSSFFFFLINKSLKPSSNFVQRLWRLFAPTAGSVVIVVWCNCQLLSVQHNRWGGLHQQLQLHENRGLLQSRLQFANSCNHTTKFTFQFLCMHLPFPLTCKIGQHKYWIQSASHRSTSECFDNSRELLLFRPFTLSPERTSQLQRGNYNLHVHKMCHTPEKWFWHVKLLEGCAKLQKMGGKHLRSAGKGVEEDWDDRSIYNYLQKSKYSVKSRTSAQT